MSHFCDMHEILEILQEQVGNVINVQADIHNVRDILAHFPDAQHMLDGFRHVHGGVGVQIRLFVNGVPVMPNGEPPPGLEEMMRHMHEHLQEHIQEHMRMQEELDFSSDSSNDHSDDYLYDDDEMNNDWYSDSGDNNQEEM
jgi:hypothetical protein